MLDLPRDQSDARQPRLMFMPIPDHQGDVQFTVEVPLGGTTTEAQLTLTVGQEAVCDLTINMQRLLQDSKRILSRKLDEELAFLISLKIELLNWDILVLRVAFLFTSLGVCLR